MKREKSFDCVEMKRRIQSKIYAETKNMSREEFVSYMQRRVEEGPFATLVKRARNKGRES
jgi:chemotaxis regulatin CheY-phosphate phosphatase CheZ